MQNRFSLLFFFSTKAQNIKTHKLSLTRRKSGFLDDALKSVINKLTIHKKPQIAINGRFPFSHRPLLRLLHFLLTFLSLFSRVQSHRHKPHLLHKPLRLARVPLFRFLRRRRRYDAVLPRRFRLHGHARQVTKMTLEQN